MAAEPRSASVAQAPGSLSWPVPATTTHDGVPLGNGLFGALLWAQGSTLRMTINRSDYWDHRGGITFGPEATYANLRRWLEEGNEAELRRVFEGAAASPGQPWRPTRLPMGRVDLGLAGGAASEASLDLGRGAAQVGFAGRFPVEVEAVIPRGRALLALRVLGLAAKEVDVQPRPPDSDEVSAYYREYGIPAPTLGGAAAEGYWLQELPADPWLCVAWRRISRPGASAELFIAAEYGPSAEEALHAAEESLEWGASLGYQALADAEADWWRDYWRVAARVGVPDDRLQAAYDLGMYKLPGISWPGTPAATLQGPWVEEYRMPPWSSDYHFNINVQECYWPAYAGNQLQALEPLFEMIHAWEPHLRDLAHAFLGIEDGLMLHHAVDDRSVCMGGFWTGSIDHGSTGWVAQLMWQYYTHSLDESFLRDTAYPFMRDTMRVYEEMLEETPEGTLRLPVSVSPEYGGSALWAWGANASFQLAIIHFLCRALVRAVEVLGLPDDTARWVRIDRLLPMGAIAGEGDARELLLWEGQPLARSHRHHSHLAGLHPFDVFDYWGSESDRRLIDNAARTWTRIGMGEWSGWCMPWAAILQARMHNGERAALLLEEHGRVFVTPGRATTHDAVLQGFTALAMRPDIMQIEATMAATTAVLEMLLHTAQGITYVFPAIPAEWRDVRFERIRTEGAVLISAERSDGRTTLVRALGEKGGRLCLAWPFGRHDALLRSSLGGGDRGLAAEDILEITLAPGEEIVLVPRPTHPQPEEHTNE